MRIQDHSHCRSTNKNGAMGSPLKIASDAIEPFFDVDTLFLSQSLSWIFAQGRPRP
jgi:hypothetical protein